MRWFVLDRYVVRDFIQIIHEYTIWYLEKRIKTSLAGWLAEEQTKSRALCLVQDFVHIPRLRARSDNRTNRLVIKILYIEQYSETIDFNPHSAREMTRLTDYILPRFI